MHLTQLTFPQGMDEGIAKLAYGMIAWAQAEVSKYSAVQKKKEE